MHNPTQRPLKPSDTLEKMLIEKVEGIDGEVVIVNESERSGGWLLLKIYGPVPRRTYHKTAYDALTWLDGYLHGIDPVSYTHLTLPTNREV